MGMQNIEKWSLGYELLRKFVGLWHNLFYYRNIFVLGMENIPEDEQIILAVSHQNALMDAMVLLQKIKKQPVFLARSDIFRKRFIARLLYFIKIMPIYRIRDGFSELKKNEEIFRKTTDVLEHHSALAILPEGSHAHMRKVRPLKKGIARIAFQLAEKQNFSKEIKIVPVGLDYSDYHKFRQDLIINFGPPIGLAKYYDLYRENPPKAILEVIRELREAIKKQMVHIEADEKYTLYNDILRLFLYPVTTGMGLNPHDPAQRLEAQQKFVKLLEEYLREKEKETGDIQAKLDEYKKVLSSLKLPGHVVGMRSMSLPGFLWRAVTSLLLLPLFLYGFIFNFAPYIISYKLARRFKDQTFHSSFKFVFSLFLFPAFHLVETGIFFLIVHQPWFTLAFFISLPLTGLFAHRYFIMAGDFLARRRYARLLRSKHPEMEKLQTLYRYFTDLIQRVIPEGKAKG